jgi:L-histidine Nalpha-methyltransferase
MIQDHTPQHARLSCRAVRPARVLPGLEEDVRRGLLEPPRSLPPKYFYDERGSQLFDAICDTPEYYVTRTEDALLLDCAGELVDVLRPAHIIEFGSGASRKTRHLFDQCASVGNTAVYWPFDVCEEMLLHSGRHLLHHYDWLQVNALVGDYSAGLCHLPRPGGDCLYLFLGGTIGNFMPAEALAFLREVRAGMGPGDRLLLGADRVKAPEILHAAYNDGAGITAEFNLNLLQVLNRELEADFDRGAFEHEAVYNEPASRIEMYLVSRRDQSVRLARLDRVLELVEGERILTEISRKFTPDSLTEMLTAAGFAVERHFEADKGFFSLMLAAPAE